MQFYNTPSCSARAGLDHSYGAYGGPETDISYDSWVEHVQTKSANKEAKIYLGLPADTGATFGEMNLSPEEAQELIEKFQCKWPTMFGGVMLWEATFSENNQIDGMSYGQNIEKGLENCFCANEPSSTSSVMTSSTISSSSIPTLSTSGIESSSDYHPTSSSTSSSAKTSSTMSSSAVPTLSTSSTSSSLDYHPTSSSTSSTSHPVTGSSSSAGSSSSTSFTTTYDDLSTSSTTSASPSSSPSSCGIKGYDKSPAYNFLNDTISATFEKCSARCVADSSCASFAFGYTQCLLYTQTV